MYATLSRWASAAEQRVQIKAEQQSQPSAVSEGFSPGSYIAYM